jgi:hypothetical protein
MKNKIINLLNIKEVYGMKAKLSCIGLMMTMFFIGEGFTQPSPPPLLLLVGQV